MGSLDTWAGLAQGLESGLGNYMKIRQIQNQEERDRQAVERDRLAEQRWQKGEERALRAEDIQRPLNQITLDRAAREKTEYDRLHTPSIDPIKYVLARNPGAEEGDIKSILSLVPGGGSRPISPAEAKEVDPLLSTPALTKGILQSRIGRGRERVSLGETSLDEANRLSMGEEEGFGLGGYAQSVMAKRAALDSEKQRLADLQLEDPREVVRIAREHAAKTELRATAKEGRDIETHAAAQKKARRDDMYAAGTIDKPEKAEAMAAEATDSVEKAKWLKLARTLHDRAKEIKTAVARAERTFAPSDTEKKFNFWKSLYPHLSSDEIQKKVIKEDIPSEARYVLDYVKEIIKGGGSPGEVKAAEIEARALYRKITGDAGKPPTIGMSPPAPPVSGPLNRNRYVRDPQGNVWEVEPDGRKRIVTHAPGSMVPKVPGASLAPREELIFTQ
ncbi:MAG: hypothetical protein ABIJ57_09455 [Pseudomonadota bacterium]|uniref:Uncharacterized protein n=1 Tax=viral metagenome TaxID=1070528 RepID=A0A6M3KPP3_9ZZZZ